MIAAAPDLGEVFPTPFIFFHKGKTAYIARHKQGVRLGRVGVGHGLELGSRFSL